MRCPDLSQGARVLAVLALAATLCVCVYSDHFRYAKASRYYGGMFIGGRLPWLLGTTRLGVQLCAEYCSVADACCYEVWLCSAVLQRRS